MIKRPHHSAGPQNSFSGSHEAPFDSKCSFDRIRSDAHSSGLQKHLHFPLSAHSYRAINEIPSLGAAHNWSQPPTTHPVSNRKAALLAPYPVQSYKKPDYRFTQPVLQHDFSLPSFLPPSPSQSLSLPSFLTPFKAESRLRENMWVGAATQHTFDLRDEQDRV